MNINKQLSNKKPLHGALLSALVLLFSISACAGAHLNRQSVPGEYEIGLAVYYADSLHGNKTASGIPYNKNALTGAHPTLPFGTLVKVTNLSNRKSVKIEINDRGPFGDRKRIIDLSRKAAETIDMISVGVQEVRVELISGPSR